MSEERVSAVLDRKGGNPRTACHMGAYAESKRCPEIDVGIEAKCLYKSAGNGTRERRRR